MHLDKRPFAKVFEHSFAIFSAPPDLAVLERLLSRLIHHPLRRLRVAVLHSGHAAPVGFSVAQRKLDIFAGLCYIMFRDDVFPLGDSFSRPSTLGIESICGEGIVFYIP